MAEASEKEINEIEEELEKVFDPDLTVFKTFMRLLSNLIYYLDYPAKGLKIVVTTPLKYKGYEKYEIEKGRMVKFAIYFHEKPCLEFTDSRIVDGWEAVAKEKIETLMELAEGAPSCSICRTQTYPSKGKDFQVNPKGTHFVWYTCGEKKCGISVPTPFRSKTRRKSKVSRFLKKA